MEAKWARDQLRRVQEDYHDFNPPTVPAYPYPSALEFSRQVSQGLPCVYTAPSQRRFLPEKGNGPFVNSNSHSEIPSCTEYPWRALKWTSRDLKERVTDPIEIAVTPDGRADALVSLDVTESRTTEKVFFEPATVQLTMTELLSTLTSVEPDQSTIYYLQSQNSNLDSDSLTGLMRDLPTNFDFAVDTLGDPDARNVWIGTERSVTSIHRDPYENLYLVLRGSKTFRLWPPVDEVAMPTVFVRRGRYTFRNIDGTRRFGHELESPDERMPWIDLDPLQKSDMSLMADRGAKMRTITVMEGQILYLPAGWYHHVSQKCGKWENGSKAPCIAINYWYDMDYEGEKHCMRQLLARLVEEGRRKNLEH